MMFFVSSTLRPRALPRATRDRAVTLEGVKTRRTRIRSAPRAGGAAGFGDRLRQLREERGLLQTELARLAGLQAVDISRYERYAVLPTIDNFARLVRALEVPAELLLFEKPPAGIARPEPRNLRLWSRLLELEQLDEKDQQMVLHFLDSVIFKNRIQGVVAK